MNAPSTTEENVNENSTVRTSKVGQSHGRFTTPDGKPMNRRTFNRKTEPRRSRKANFSKWPPRVLLAEDDAEMRRMLAQLLRMDGYEVVECPDGVGLLDHLSTFLGRTRLKDFDLVISDIRMPGLTGLEVIGGLHRMRGFPPTILMTAFGDQETHAQARQIGVVAMFDKPFKTSGLMAKVRETVPLSESAALWNATRQGLPRSSNLFPTTGEGI